MSNLIALAETYLGRIQHGWNQSVLGTPMEFQVAECRDGLLPDVTSFLTLGLANVELASRMTGRCVRHELMLAVGEKYSAFAGPALLQQVGNEALERGTAYLRGDVIGPRGEIYSGGKLQSLYVTFPSCYPDELSVFCEHDGAERIIAWLVPITREEAGYITTHGWNHFEDLLVARAPDLFDLDRASIV